MASLQRGRSFVESLVGDNSALKNLFAGGSKPKSDVDGSPPGGGTWIKELSSLANIVIGRCCRILALEPEELQQRFEDEASDEAKQSSRYARNLVEYACFKALSVATQSTDRARNKEFSRLVFDMMLAWETPGAAHKPAVKPEVENISRASSSMSPEAPDSFSRRRGQFEAGSSREVTKEHGEGKTAQEDDEEDSALFYSDLMPMLVDVETTVGDEAFARVAPVVPLAADTISVHQQFEALTASTGGRLSYPTFEKYLSELERSVKNMKSNVNTNLASSLKLAKGETVIEIDGTATTQPVLQHVGVSTWPGRLTLTSQALYFEAAGVVSYDKAKKFDLSADLRHIVKPDLTGPWGARLFDKAVMYKSSATSDPIVLEFPEFTGRSRRDYWLAIIREIVAVHNFNRTFRLESVGKAEALAKAVLGIARLRATREIFHVLPQRPESLLTFSNADTMPSGDIVLAALADQLQIERLSYLGEALYTKQDSIKLQSPTSPSLTSAFPLLKGSNSPREQISVGDVLIGEPTPLEKAVLTARDNTRKVELAKATIDGVRLDGIDTNIAVMKELLLPVSTFTTWIQALFNWDDAIKSTTFTMVSSYIIYRDWLRFIIPLVLLSAIVYMLSLRHSGKRDNNEVVVPAPPSQNTVEQLLALQQALAQLEVLLQSGNITLLKFRALFVSVLPQRHSGMARYVVAGMAFVALLLAILPSRFILLLIFLEIFTRYCIFRKETSKRWIRRLKEWWYIVPPVNVRFSSPEEGEL